MPLRMYIKDCSPLNRLKKVPVLKDMDEEGLKEICEYLKPMKYTNDIIIEEGEPLQLMLIIVEGVATIEQSSCSSNSQRGVGELCGEELLSWPALISFPNKLLASKSARAMGDVEALVLMASDMESVGIKFATLFQEYGESNQLYFYLQTIGAAIFTEKDLNKATNNYHVSGVLGEGGSATIHKGTLPNKLGIAVKKFKSTGFPSEHQLGNEVLVLSSITHKNVVRLIGCCIETKLPILVLEYITNGSLFEHIQKRNGKGSPPLPLELRIKVAAETARAVAYLHSTRPMILHGDVKSRNILLDENYSAKLIDFQTARFVADDQASDHDYVLAGTPGYFDPEYYSNVRTGKSDVYSFGVVLMELLTSETALSYSRPVKERNLASFFVAQVEEGRLDHILDHEIVGDGNVETAKKLAVIAERCTRISGEERPSMKEVATELEVLMGI